MMPRATWIEVMLRMAEAAASRSRDASTRVGAVVASPKWRVLGTGYNGGPAGSPISLPNAGPSRHLWVIHAEVNALLQAVAATGSIELTECMLFSTHRPCAACIKFASHLRVKWISYLKDELSDEQREQAIFVADTLGVFVQPWVK